MAYRLKARIGGKECRHALGPGTSTLGADPGNDVVLADPTVSRRHARIHCDDAGLAVEDLGSRNGTWVNSRAAKDPTPLHPGDRVQFGDVAGTIEVLSGDDVEAAVEGAVPGTPEAPASDALPTLDGSRLGRLITRALVPLIREMRSGASPLQGILTTLHQTFPEARLTLKRADGYGALIGEAGASGGGARGRLRLNDLLLEWQAPRPLHPDIEAAGHVLLELCGLAAPAHVPRESPEAVEAALPAPETQHPGLRRTYREAAQVARGQIGVLITGDSGTGKELLARYIHAASGLPRDRLLVLNCAALPENLLEAELFGIEKGVATGVDARPGKFEMAHGGTLFLDEIGEMTPATQSKILRVLQEKTTYRVGGHEPRPANVRIISATNQPLEAMIERGDFRRDLYHRIAGWTARLPGLAERSMDILNLAAHFLEREMTRRGETFGGIAVSAAEALRAYPWPGNVRELELEMARAALFLQSGEMLDFGMLEERIRSHEGAESGDLTLDAQLRRAEETAIRDALTRTGGNVSTAAAQLGIGRSTIYRRMRELEISVETEDSGEGVAK